MSHVRQQIRDYVAAILSPVAASVHTSRVYELEANDLPAIKIYSLSEASEFDTSGFPRGIKRELQLVVEVVVKSTLSFDDRIDTLCARIESIMSGDVNLGGLSKDVYLEVTSIDLSDGGEMPHGTANMSWIVKYRIRETDSETAIL